MRVRRWPWVATGMVGVVLVAGGGVWLFVALGAEKADRISSGVGAGAALVGLVMALLSWVRTRGSAGSIEGGSPEIRQSVQNSVIMGPNVQVGGSVAGRITVDGSNSARRPDDREPGT